MASVFLSYDHDDAARAAPVASALESAGHKVWWDRHIAGGAEYNSEIEGAVDRANAVVVLWSERSVRSAWVRDEAAEGRDQGKLVPVTLDGAKPPMGFRQFQTIDLSKCKGSRISHHLNELLDAIDKLAQGEVPPDPRKSAGTEKRAQRPPIRLVLVSSIVLILLAGAGTAVWRISSQTPSVPTVAVAPAEAAADADALARDLLVKLGSLRSAKTDAVRLTAAIAGQPSRADFLFETADSNDPKNAGANLALLDGTDRSVLWSKDFEITGASRTALEQSMAYTAGQVLDCALQTSATGQPRLDEQTLKLFLNGCALFAERYRSDPTSVIPIFSQVLARAPRLEPAWSKLLLAEAQNMRAQMLFYDRWAPGGLQAHIRAARQLNPALPELYIAEAALLPLGALEQRSRLFDEAVRHNPDNPDLRLTRSEFLSAIGRNNDAVEDSRRAAELDPLSPGIRSNLIQMLAYAGQLPSAEEELRRAELLWPASPTTDDARFRLTSRFGDPREALQMLQSPEFRQTYPTQEMGAYLQARINPTKGNIERAIAAARSAQLAPIRRLVQLIQLLGDFGRNEELYQLVLDTPPDKLREASEVFFRPGLRKFRQDPRFMQIALRAGLIDFWRKNGTWPDFCLEPDLPYNCKKEAARLAS